LSNFEGSPLDPIIAIRRTISLEPKESGTATLVSAVSATHDGVMALIQKYQDQAIANRSFELAWTHGLIMLRHLNATEPDAQLYGSLASALLYHQPTRRAAASTLLQNRRGQQNLWSFGISGDVPIVLVYSTHVELLDFVRQMLQAHSYWRLTGLQVDLVILNEDDSVYRQSLHDQILTLIATGNAAQLVDKPGGIFTRRVDQLSHEDRILLESSARIVLTDRKGTLAEQLKRRVRPEPMPPALVPRVRWMTEQVGDLPKRDVTFFNGLGGFTRDGREYVVTLRPDQSTHAPWVNVLGNPNFGTVISESGASYTWRENCHQFRLTTWHNDAVTDTTGEAFYVRDEDTGRYWSPRPGLCAARRRTSRGMDSDTPFLNTPRTQSLPSCGFMYQSASR
jgi:cellobiose phosphorylase